MQNNYFKIFIIFLFSGCTPLKEVEEYCFRQINIEQRASKKIIINDDFESVPKVSKTTLTLRKDSGTHIIFTNKRIIKRHKGENYYYFKSSSDTIELNIIDTAYLSSDFQISGNFVPPKSDFWTASKFKGTQFNLDGSCVETFIHSYSDSWGSITEQRLGEYRYVKDTIYITYFLKRSISNNVRRLKDNSRISITEVQWHLSEPFSEHHILSNTSDTLNQAFDSRYGKVNSFMVLSDTLKLLPTKPKLH